MKLLEGMNYRQWQKRNKEIYNSLAQEQQRQAKKRGFYNSGWEKVKKSWAILQDLQDNNSKIVSLFDHELSKGNLIPAINIAILGSEQGKKIVEQGQRELEKIHKNLTDIADKALAKYPLL
jgi:hypothetical protein